MEGGVAAAMARSPCNALALLALLTGVAVAWDPKPHYEMEPCDSEGTDTKECHFYVGTKVRAATAVKLQRTGPTPPTVTPQMRRTIIAAAQMRCARSPTAHVVTVVC